MPAGDVYRISIQGNAGGSIFMNVLAVRQIGAVDITGADLQVLADGFKDAWRTSQSTAIAWRNWRAVQVFGPNVDYTVKPCKRVGGFTFEGNLTGTLAGSITGDMLPPQCALVITLGTGTVGRTHRGRVYGFGLGETDQAAGQFTAGAITAITNTFTIWFNKYKSGGSDPKLQLGIWSDRTAFGCVWKGDPPTHQVDEGPHPDLAFTPVTGFTVRSAVNTQRRRAVGVGR